MLGLWTQVLGTQAWHIQLMRGKHLLVQRVGRMKLRLRKSLQWPFLLLQLLCLHSSFMWDTCNCQTWWWWWFFSCICSGHPPIWVLALLCSERCPQSKLNPYKATVKKLHQCAEKELTWNYCNRSLVFWGINTH